MANYTNNYQLIFLNQNQITKDVIINQNFAVIDSITHIKAIDYTSTPPSNPNQNDVYLVNAQATGVWSGQDQKIAVFQNNAWIFLTPGVNCICNVFYLYGCFLYNGSFWKVASVLPKIGDYKTSAQNTDHDNWMICDGRAISRSKYNQLFSILSTKFGIGDNLTTFNIPKIPQNSLFQNSFIFFGLV